MYTLQISLERVAINKIVTSLKPGGQRLPFRGMQQFLPHPTPNTHLLPFLSGGCGLESWDTKKKFHIKFIARKFLQTNYIFSSWPVSFKWKHWLISFLYFPTFTSHLEIVPNILPGYLSTIKSAVLCELWKNNGTSFYYPPSNTLMRCMGGAA